MAGYIRQSTFSDGDTITAALFNNEYDQLLNVFSNTSGHKHDGTAAEGPVIGLIGDAGLVTPLNKILIDTTNDHIEFWVDVSGTSTQQLYIADGAILPVTDNDIDLGSSSLEFKDLYIDGTANIDSLVADTADINGGSLDNVTIGATTAAAGTFTTVDTSGNVTVGGNLTVSGTTTTVNSNEVNIGDNIIVLNSDETGTPSQNGGIEIERGTSTNVSLLWNETNDYWTFGSNHLNFPDNSKAYFGTGNDLEIYHDGSSSYIKDSGAGVLNLLGSGSVRIKGSTAEELLARFNENGSVQLYYDNAEKLATTSAGIDVTGGQRIIGNSGDAGSLEIYDVDNGTASTDALRIVKSANEAYIFNRESSGGLSLGAGNTLNHVVITSAGNVGIGADSPSRQLTVQNSGNAIAAIVSGTSSLAQLALGDTDDDNYAQIILENSTNKLQIQNGGGGAVGNRGITLDSSENVGIGTESPSVPLHVYRTGNADFYLERASGARVFGQAQASAGVLGTNTNHRLDIKTNGTTRMTLNTSGNVGIGVTNPTRKLHLDSAGTTTGAAYIYSNAVHTGVTTQSILAAYSDNASSSGTVLFVRGDGSGNLVHVKKGSADAFVIDSSSNATISGNLTVTGNATINGNLTFGNAATDTVSFGADIDSHIIPDDDDTYDLGSATQQWRDLYLDGVVYADQIDLGDNERIRLGASQDLEIYHDGSNSYISESGTGSLILKSGGTMVLRTPADENMIHMTANGAVKLYHDNSEKLATTSSGIDVTGGADAIAKVTGTTTAARLDLATNSHHRFWQLIESDGRARFYDQTANAERFTINSSGKVGIGISSPVEKLDVSGNIQTNDTVILNNGSVKWQHLVNSNAYTLRYNGGAWNEYLRISVDGNVGIGTTSPDNALHVKHATTNVVAKFESGDNQVWINLNDGGGGTYGALLGHDSDAGHMFAIADSSVSKKFVIDSSGNLGIGTTSPSDKVEVYANGADVALKIHEDAGTHTARLHLREGTQDTYIQNRAGNGFEIRTENNISTSSTAAMQITAGGDITTGYNLTVGGNLTVSGTTTTLNTATLDVEDKNITLNKGSGDTSSTADGAGITIQDAVDASNDATLLWDATNDKFDFSHSIQVPDNANVKVGSAGDLFMVHNGTNSYIQNKVGDLYIENASDDKDIFFRSDNGSGGLSTYFQLDGSEVVTSFLKTTRHSDNVKAMFGSSNDLQIYHDGGNSFIREVGTGNFYIEGAGAIRFRGATTQENMIEASENGAVTLYHDNSAKLATTSTGIDVTGTVGADGLNLGTTGNATLANILSADNTSNTLISGGNATNAGANYALFGGSHASLANVHRWRVGGTEIARFDASGNLGIGTTSPAKKLEVVSTNAGTDFEGIQIRNNSTTASSASILRFVNSTDSSSTLNSGFIKSLRNAGDDNDLIFGTVGSERVRIDSSGNVGIGNSTPTGKLHVYDSGTDTYGTQPIAIFDYYDTDDAALRYSARIGDGSTTFKTFVTGSLTDFLIVDQDNQSGRLAFQVQGNAGNIEALAVDSTGLVGIGTTSPATRLEVKDDSGANTTLRVSTDGTATPDPRIQLYRNSGAYGEVRYNPGGNIGGESGLVYTDYRDDTSSKHIWQTRNAEKMRLDSVGNLGIGTTAPSDTLHVAGIIRTHSSSTSKYIRVFGGNSGNFLDSYGNTLFIRPDGNSSNAVALDTAGNVGIGTTSPSSLLHLESASSPTLQLKDTTNNVTFKAYAQNSDAHLATTSNHDLIIDTNNTERMRIKSSGRVGIGTDSPTETLDVAGSAKFISVSPSYTDTNGTSSSTNYFKLGRIVLLGSQGAIITIMGTTSYSSGNNISGETKIYLRGNNSTSTLSGHFFGTTSGNTIVEAVAWKQTGTNNEFDIWIKYGGSFAGLEHYIETDGGWTQDVSDTGSTSAPTGSTALTSVFAVATAGNERMRIDSSGNVGIGTTSPAHLLDVNGSGRINGLTFGANGATRSITTHSDAGKLQLSGGTGTSNAAYIEIEGDDFGGTDLGGDISFVSNGAARMFINRSGNVGIGTTTPGTLLHLFNASDPTVRVQDSSSGMVVGLQANDSAGFVGTTSNSDFAIRTNNSTRLHIENSGNVGIGTTSPSSKLSVHGGSSGTDTDVFRISSSTGAFNVRCSDLSAANPTWTLRTFSAEPIAFAIATTEAMRIDGSGNVGIGTTSPNQKLVISEGDGETTLSIDNATTTTGNHARIFLNHNGILGARIQSENIEDFTTELKRTANLSFHTRNNGTQIEAVRIKEDGNVGIGTDSPSSILHLKDTIAQVKINSNDGQSAFLTFGDASDTTRGGLEYTSDDALVFETNNMQERMRIDSSGNLLVGATSPKNTFAEKTLSVISSASNSQGMIEIGGNNTSDTFISGLSFTNEQSTDTSNFQRIAQIFAARDGNNNAGDLVFNVHDGSTLNRGMTIKSSGNVGIGTTSPTVPLEVSGHVKVGDADASSAAGDSQLNVKAISGEDAIVRVMAPSGNDSELRLGVLGTSGVNSLKFGDVLDNDVGYIQYDHGSNYLRFGTNAGERARIDSSGNLLVGTTSTPSGTVEGISNTQSGVIYAAAAGTAPVVLYRHDSDGNIVNFHRDGTQVGTISVTGSATAYNTSSDARLKDITGSARGLAVINELNPVAYDWKADGKSDEGLIAQEVMELVPNAVSGSEEDMYQMDYSKLVVHLVKGMQEQQKQIESLKSEIQLLKGGN